MEYIIIGIMFLIMLLMFFCDIGKYSGYPKESLIRVRYKDTKYSFGTQAVNGDCVDMYVPQDIEYKAGDTVKVDFGVAMELPVGFEAHVYPRSSTFKNTGLLLTNSVGIIDNDYNGNDDTWGAMFYATRDGKLEAGQRVCQFRIFRNQPDLIFLPVKHLGNENRGGYGSTGK